MATVTHQSSPPTLEEVSLPITGMTCASCVRRVEKSLTKVDGVTDAGVNLATERAKVRYDPQLVGLAQLKSAVEKAGYGIRELPGRRYRPPHLLCSPDFSVPTAPGEATLPIEGMTCASCVRRVERALTKVEGVSEANVNLATEKASVSFDPGLVELPQLTGSHRKGRV